MSDWIAVTDRLPETPKGGGKSHVLAYASAKSAQGCNKGCFFAYWNGRDWRYIDGDRFEYRITHWQPLPAPPAE